MPSQPIPFTGSNKNTDQKFLNGINFTCRNGIVDELGNLNRRPGQSLFVDLGTAAAVTGLFYSAKHNITVAVSGQQIFTINSSAVVTDITGTGTPELGTLVTFADFGDVVYCANGGQIISIPLTGGTTTYLTDSDAPILVTHVAVLNRKLIANNLAFDARFEWSDVGDGTVWSGQFATAEAQNDKLLGLYVEDERLSLVGEKTWENWRDDGSTPFVPESQEYVQRGAITKYAPAYCRDRWIWLDEYKQLVMLNGRQAISLPQQNARGLTRFLQDLDLTDARGRYVISAGRFYYLCLLPKAEKSFFYDIDKDEWYEASFWDELNAEDDLYRAFSSTYTFGDSWGQMLIGDSKSGQVFNFDTNAYTDNNETIRTLITTGFIDRGTSENRKSTSRLSGRLKLANASKTSDGLGDEIWDESAVLVDSPIIDNGDGTYTVDGTQITSVDVYNLSIAKDNTSYRTSFEIVSVSAGSAVAKVNGTVGTSRMVSGAYEEEITSATANRTGINLSSTFVGTVRMYSIRENIKVVDPSLKLTLKWRNENTNNWSYRPIKLYKLSNNQFRWATNSLGQYYMRQYEYEITSDADFIMSPPMETFEIVR